jgi:hypothetical protein
VTFAYIQYIFALVCLAWASLAILGGIAAFADLERREYGDA